MVITKELKQQMISDAESIRYNAQAVVNSLLANFADEYDSEPLRFQKIVDSANTIIR